MANLAPEILCVSNSGGGVISTLQGLGLRQKNRCYEYLIPSQFHQGICFDPLGLVFS